MASAADATGESDRAAAGARPARRLLVWHRLAFWVAHVAFWAVAFAANMLVIPVFQPEPADPPAFVLLKAAPGFLTTAAMRWFSHREPLLVRLAVTNPA
jgi:anti-sigma-K factor RskA